MSVAESAMQMRSCCIDGNTHDCDAEGQARDRMADFVRRDSLA